MDKINVRYQGQGLGTLDGKQFAPGDTRPVSAVCADVCDGKIWVNLDAKPESKGKKEEKPESKGKKEEKPDESQLSASPVEGLSEEQVNEALAVLPDLLRNPALCLGDGRPEVKALTAAAGFDVSAAQRDEIYGLHLELSGNPEG